MSRQVRHGGTGVRHGGSGVMSRGWW